MKFAVIGNPIEKSLSPQLHEILYEKLNISNCSFEKIHIENDELDDFFKNPLSLKYLCAMYEWLTSEHFW